jgi:stage II sporulation protein D
MLLRRSRPFHVPAIVLVSVLLAGCAGRRPATPGEAPPARLPLAPGRALRIGVAVERESLLVTAGAPLVLERGGEVIGRFRRLVLTAGGDRQITLAPAGAGPRTIADTLRFRAQSKSAPITLDGVTYRGTVAVFADGRGRFTAVNAVELEDYLRGVVPLEIGSPGADAHAAVEAQAIAARTYAVAHLDRWSELGFDLYGDVRDQVYGGLAAERADASRAVQGTDAVVAVFAGVLIGAYYSAACGGMTAAVEETWDFPPAPYLAPHPDRMDGEDFCRGSKHYRWEERWTAGEFMALLARTMTAEFPGPAPAGELEDVRVTARNSSGRVRVLVVRAGGRDYRLGGERGDRIRWVLRRPGGTILRSTLFDVETVRQGGKITAVIARGAGNGHGVGLCQAGALGMAARGYDYADILAHYYPGTRLVRLRQEGEASLPPGLPLAVACSAAGGPRR